MKRDEVQKIFENYKEVLLNGEEWQLGFRATQDGIPEIPDGGVIVGYSEAGNYLFLKEGKRGELDTVIFEYIHEGPLVLKIGDIESCIVNRKSWFSEKVRYRCNNQVVKLGDEVRVKGLFRSRQGKVSYLPGTSKFNPEYEAEDMVWVQITYENGEKDGYPVHPTEYTINKKIYPI